MSHLEEIEYEKNLNFNRLLSWIHSLRFKHIMNVFEQLQKKIPNRPIVVLEIGCAHAKLYNILNQKFNIHYYAIELHKSFVLEAKKRYGNNSNFNILHASASDVVSYKHIPQPDIIVALETLEHIPEKEVVRIVEQIAAMQPSVFVCSVPVEIGPAVWFKNIISFLLRYTRHKEYSWQETLWAGLYQLDKVAPHGTTHKGFDWRWLVGTIRHNMQISKMQKFPFNFFPASLANSLFIMASPRIRNSDGTS